ncbi:MAG: ribonucleotide-diphosphate reductase subunit beta [Solirubrobacteraceae bacterium]
MAMATATQSPLDSVSYSDLYRRWEHGQWRATEIDFMRDREQWRAEFSDFERTAAVWNYALFLWGEDAVTDGLSPYIEAAPLEEQKYFLATQQADEARHAVFFTRFMHEVAGLGDGRVGSGL